MTIEDITDGDVVEYSIYHKGEFYRVAFAEDETLVFNHEGARVYEDLKDELVEGASIYREQQEDA